MNNELGILQGRLTNPRERTGIQFPLYNLDEIRTEFEIAKYINLDYIEWNICKGIPNLFLGNFYDQQQIEGLIKSTNTQINSVCLDYLMDLDLKNNEILNFAKDSINWIANIASNIGCKIIMIPIHNINMNMLQIGDLISLILERYNIKIVFEFLDSSSSTGITFLNSLQEDVNLGCCFDIGNNCLILSNIVTPPQKNYESIIKEMTNYHAHNYLYHIHIKEKDKHGNTVQLGNGLIGKKGWKKIFKFLKDIDYSGDFTLQVAREENGKETETIKKQIEFIKDLM